MSWRSVEQRYGAQLGHLDAILRTRGSFVIQYQNPKAFQIALQIARNLFQYFAADSALFVDDEIKPGTGNRISIRLGPSHLVAPPCFAIMIQENKGLSIRDSSGRERLYPFEKGLGAIYLRPLQKRH